MSVAAPALNPRRVAVRHGWTIGVYLLLVAVFIVEVIVAPVFTAFDLQSLVIVTLPLAFAAMAQATIVISGGIDLSVGAQMALINVCSAKLMKGEGLGVALLIALAMLAGGMFVGSLTGAVITATRVPDIVVTLATSFIWSPSPGTRPQAPTSSCRKG